MNHEPTAKVPIPSISNEIDDDAQNPRFEETTAPAPARMGWREAFRMAWGKARKQQKPYLSRQDLGRDRTRSLIVLLTIAAVLLLVFFGLFSRQNQPRQAGHESARPKAGLGRPTAGTSDSEKLVTPILSAEIGASDGALPGQVTPEDVKRTARTGQVPKPSPATRASERQNFALSGVDFSDPLDGKNGPAQPQVSSSVPVRMAAEQDSRKPSLIFVRATSIPALFKAPPPEVDSDLVPLPPGTRLLARLEAPISSIVPTPVIAVIEYNYERDGQIVVPAGAKALGRVTQASSSGDCSIQFSRLEMPDGTAERLEASAMGLNFRSLRGYVSGKKTGAKFLVRSLTGLGTVASYLLGPQASSSAGLVSTNVLMRERLADNVATAGQEELSGLAFNQNPVVTVPGNTRLYVVLEKQLSGPTARMTRDEATAGNREQVNRSVPSLEELRQLIELKREINELYLRDNEPLAREARQQE